MLRRLYNYELRCDFINKSGVQCDTEKRFESYNPNLSLMECFTGEYKGTHEFTLVRDFNTGKYISYCESCFYFSFESMMCLYIDRSDLLRNGFTPTRISYLQNGKTTYLHWWQVPLEDTEELKPYDVFYDMQKSVLLCVKDRNFIDTKFLTLSIDSLSELDELIGIIDKLVQKYDDSKSFYLKK